MTSYFLPKEWITFSTLFHSEDCERIVVKRTSKSNEAIKNIKINTPESLKNRFIKTENK